MASTMVMAAVSALSPDAPPLPGGCASPRSVHPLQAEEPTPAPGDRSSVEKKLPGRVSPGVASAIPPHNLAGFARSVPPLAVIALPSPVLNGWSESSLLLLALLCRLPLPFIIQHVDGWMCIAAP